MIARAIVSGMSTLLAEYIAGSGLTQTEFARRAGIPQPMISQYASGERLPDIDHAFTLEDATSGKVAVAYWRELKRKTRKPSRRVRKG